MNGIILLNLLSASFAAGAADVTHTLTTASGAVEFTVGDRGAFISRWEMKTGGEMKHLLSDNPRIPFWTVTTQQTSGDRGSVTSLDGPALAPAFSDTGLTLAWIGLGPGKVDVTVSVSVRGADLVWELDATVNARNCALWDITFPEIGPIASPDAVHSITSGGWGLVHADLTHRPLIEGTYPSAQCSMPFAAVSDGVAGLYVGAEDGGGNPLHVFAGQTKGRPAVTVGLRHDIPGMGVVTKYTIPYPLVTTAYAGDWYEAAQLYRHAAQKTAWGGAPSLRERKDMPKWLLDTDLWYIGACEDEKTAAEVLAFAKHFKVPVSAHIYTWHQIPFDDHYPEYFPAKPGFSEAVAKVQQAGVAVMPYINGRLWDAANASWKAKNAQDAAAITVDGKRYEEVYGSKAPLTPMCPATPLWQDTVTQLVDRLVNEVGVKGVYIDQISAAAPRRCFAANHGHPKGGGTYWIQGYRELLRCCRAVLPSGAALTTEENADPWNDLLQAFLMVNTNPRGGRIVPLYPAVYGGRVVYFGFQYFSEADYAARYPLRVKLAQELTFGSQLGWVGPAILDARNVTEAAFLEGLCRVRHGSRDALQFGELLPPVTLDGKGTVTWTEGDAGARTTQTAPAVFAGAWRAPQGRRVLAIVNVADEEQPVSLTLDARHTGEITADRVDLRTDFATSAATLHRDGQVGYRGSVTISARSALALEIAAAP